MLRRQPVSARNGRCDQACGSGDPYPLWWWSPVVRLALCPRRGTADHADSAASNGIAAVLALQGRGGRGGSAAAPGTRATRGRTLLDFPPRATLRDTRLNTYTPPRALPRPAALHPFRNLVGAELLQPGYLTEPSGIGDIRSLTYVAEEGSALQGPRGTRPDHFAGLGRRAPGPEVELVAHGAAGEHREPQVVPDRSGDEGRDRGLRVETRHHHPDEQPRRFAVRRSARASPPGRHARWTFRLPWQ